MTVLSNIITPSNVLTTTNTATVTNKTLTSPTVTGMTVSDGTANGVTYLNGSKVLTSGSALTFDGTRATIGGGGIYDNAMLSIATPSQVYSLLVDGGTTSNKSRGGFYHPSLNVFALNADSAASLAFTLNTTEGMRLTSTGLGIGTSSPVSKIDARSTSAVIGNYQQIQAFSTDTAAINLGGGISLGGYYSGTAGLASFGTIVGRKENSTDGNYAGYLAFGTNAQATGVVERMRLDSAGNLGLGVTPSAWSLGKAFEIGATGSSIWNVDNSNIAFTQNAYYNGGWKYARTQAASYYDQFAGAHRWNTAASGTAGNPISFTQAMTLDASGNLLVGQTSGGSFKLDVLGNGQFSGTSADTRILMTSTGVANTVIGFNNSGSTNFVGAPTGTAYLACAQAYPLVFGINTTERARIDSSGNLLVGDTTNSRAARLRVEGGETAYFTGYGNSYGIGLWMTPNASATGGTATAISFQNVSNATVGTIATTASATAYNTSSDYRLKNTIAPMTGALAKVALLKPCTYKWNVDGSDGEGFIAHELAEVCPNAVTGAKDAVDADGNPKYQGIDTSFLVATLTSALQELNAKFEAYVASHP